METKKCSKCKEIKNVSEFYKSKISKDGFVYFCKKCVQFNRREYCQRLEIKKKKVEQQKKYLQKPKIKKRNNKYQKEYSQRLEVKKRKKERAEIPANKEKKRLEDQKPRIYLNWWWS